MISARRLTRLLLRGSVVTGSLVATALVLQVLGGPVTYSGFGPEEARVVSSAIARFETAALDLPSTHVRKVQVADRCHPRGTARDSWPVKLARICTVEEEVVVHELAHTWAFVNLTGQERLDFALRRGTPTWRSREHPWMDRAAEHAADILTWYLYWSEVEEDRFVRIGGDASVEAYLSDLSWMIGRAEAPAAMDVLVSRAADLAPKWVASEGQ